MEIIYKKDAVNCTAVPPLILLFELKGFSFFLFRYMQFYTRDKKCLIISDIFLNHLMKISCFLQTTTTWDWGYQNQTFSESNQGLVCLYTFGFILFFFPLRVTGSPHPYTLFRGVRLRGNGAEDDLTPYQEHSTRM